MIHRPPGIDVTRYNPKHLLYLRGRDSVSDSVRFAIDEHRGNYEIQKRVGKIWKPSSMDFGQHSVWLGHDVGLGAFGHHLISQSASGKEITFPHLPLLDGLTSGDVVIDCPNIKHVREVFYADESVEWTGKQFDEIVTATFDIVMTAFYLKTGATAATEPIHYLIFEGSDNTGKLILDQWFEETDFPANTEVNLIPDEFSEYEAGNYFVCIVSDADFSLKVDATSTNKWQALDYTEVREDVMLQTGAWIDGNTWNEGDWFIDSRKIHICNTTGVQEGTFAENSSLWDILGTAGTHDHNKIVSPDGLQHMTITNDDLEMWDKNGIRRISIDNAGTNLYSADNTVFLALSDSEFDVWMGVERMSIDATGTHITSPSELSKIEQSDTVFDVTRDGNLVIACNWLNTAIKAPTNPNTKIAVRNAYAHIDYEGTTRLNIDSADSELLSPNRNTYIHVRNTRVDIKQSGDNRLRIDGSQSYLRSPDTSQELKVTNLGAFYNSNEILTVYEKGIADGIVPLNSSILINEQYLPAYIDDVLDKYLDVDDTKGNGYDAFYDEAALTNKTLEESGKIYIDITAGGSTSYRWSGSVYTQLSSGVVLGETSSTAYRGDRGKIAYDHSQLPHDYEPTDVNIVRAVNDVLPVLDGSNLINIVTNETILIDDFLNKYTTTVLEDFTDEAESKIFQQGGELWCVSDGIENPQVILDYLDKKVSILDGDGAVWIFDKVTGVTTGSFTGTEYSALQFDGTTVITKDGVVVPDFTIPASSGGFSLWAYNIANPLAEVVEISVIDSFLRNNGYNYYFVKTIDEDDFASDTDLYLPTQQSVKAYVDTEDIILQGQLDSHLSTINSNVTNIQDNADAITIINNPTEGKQAFDNIKVPYTIPGFTVENMSRITPSGDTLAIASSGVTGDNPDLSFMLDKPLALVDAAGALWEFANVSSVVEAELFGWTILSFSGSIKKDGVIIANISTFVEYVYSEQGNQHPYMGILIHDAIDEDDMASESVHHLPTQQSVKAYVSSKIVNVSATSPLLSTGGLNPVISMPMATKTVAGYVSVASFNDWDDAAFKAYENEQSIGVLNGNITDNANDISTLQIAMTGHGHDKIISPNTVNDLIVTDIDLKYADTFKTRFWINDSLIALMSVQNNHSLVIGDNGITYDTVEIATVDDLHTEDKIISPDGLKSVIVTDTDLKYTDAFGDRLVVSPTGFGMFSPSGLQSLLITDDGAFYNGVEIGIGGDGEHDADRIISSDTNKTLIVGNDSTLVFNDGTNDRINILSTVSYIKSPNGVNSFKIADTWAAIGVAGVDRLNITATISQLFSPNELSDLIIGNRYVLFNDENRQRFSVLDAGTKLISADGTSTIIVANAGTNITGKLGIGVSSPLGNIHSKGSSEHHRMQATIVGDGAWQSWYTSAGARRGYFGFGGTSSDDITLNNETGGDIKLAIAGSPSPFWASTASTDLYGPNQTRWVVLDNSVCRVSRTWTVGSDRRLKENIQTLDNTAIDFINNLNPVSYNRKDSLDELELGFIAQEVEEIQVSDIVHTDKDGMKGVGYTEIIAPIVAYIQDLQRQINELR